MPGCPARALVGGIVIVVRSLRILALCLLAVVPAACSGDAGDPARFSVRKPGASAAPAPSRAAQSASVELPANLPPASMFLGSQSLRTAPSRYCRGEECLALSPPAVSALQGPVGSPVIFSVSATPRRVRLEVFAPRDPTPAIVPLTPGSAIAWQPQMPSGTYRLTLTATYDETEVAWPFALTILASPKRG